MLSAKKKVAKALNGYIDCIDKIDVNYREPSLAEMRELLDPHLLEYIDTLPVRVKKPLIAVRYRPLIAAVAIILLCSVFSIPKVRAGIIGAMTNIVNVISGDTSKNQYIIDMSDAILMTSDTQDCQVYSQYSINGITVYTILEESDRLRETWVDMPGVPFIVNQLSFPPYEAMCYEDETCLYGIIEINNLRLSVVMYATDRELFTDILRSIRPKETN